MKLLVDSCISELAADELRRLNHDVIWAGDRNPDPGDETLLNEAFEDDRIVVTLDKDFGELAVVFGRPHHGIMRLVNFRSGIQAQIVQLMIERHGDELEAGAIITVEPGRVRIRPGDDTSDSTSN